MRGPSPFFFATPLLLVSLAACAVGPDFTPPPAPDVMAYDATPTPAVTEDGLQYLRLGGKIPAQWWELFHSPKLDRLVAAAIANNPDLAAAEASLRASEAELAAGSGELFPTVSAKLTSERQKTARPSSGGFAPPLTYSLHNASVGVSYGLDVFGGTRRAVEELQAQTDAARYQKDAAWLTLTGNVVTAAVQEASLRAQIVAARAVAKDQAKILDMTKASLAAGAVGKNVVDTQTTALADAFAVIPPLEHQLAATRHELAVLTGQMPQQRPHEFFALADLRLPKEIPLSLPSKLVAQRPDILQAQANMHAASAAIGVTVAARLPEITLSANLGSMANAFDKLFSPGGGFWNLGASAAETVFDGGTLLNKERAARAQFDVSKEQYRKTVLTAFENVADALHALQSDAEILIAKKAAANAATDASALALAQFKAGATSKTDLLSAQSAAHQALSALTQAEAQRYADTAALLVALGGGWWNHAPSPSNSPKVSHD
ncbi:MAG: efflux transporter outer membrane subunit [Alphaproteobacteria bacterium]|nr:efflux transporter outer membrane subunit [Alphaproteobacteria bacterium]